MNARITRLLRGIGVHWQRRRKTYLLLAVPNAVLLLINLVLLFRPQVIDGLVQAENISAVPFTSTSSVPRLELPKPSIISGLFLPGTSLDVLLKQKGFTPSQIRELFTASKPAYDLSKVKAGNRYTLELSKDSGQLQQFRYDVDEERYLTIRRGEKGWEPKLNRHPLIKRAEAVSGAITDNLFNAIVDAGEKEILALEISNVFQWDVDFDTDLRVGDGFRLLVEKYYLDGQFVKYGSVLVAEMSNQGKVYKGILYQPPGGRAEYFGGEGQPLRRELRKSPLQFMAPISSRFSRSRFHPILKVYRPHLGIDYMAPEGTPVVAIADGRVAVIGKDSGGGGNMIRLEHRGSMATMYLHLSRFASGLKSGETVRQGAVIGYVGQTGLATGPHLDFRMLKSGRYLNPAKVQGTPVDPLTVAQMPKFIEARDVALRQLSAVPLPMSTSRVARK